MVPVLPTAHAGTMTTQRTQRFPVLLLALLIGAAALLMFPGHAHAVQVRHPLDTVQFWSKSGDRVAMRSACAAADGFGADTVGTDDALYSQIQGASCFLFDPAGNGLIDAWIESSGFDGMTLVSPCGRPSVAQWGIDDARGHLVWKSGSPDVECGDMFNVIMSKRACMTWVSAGECIAAPFGRHWIYYVEGVDY